MYAEKLKYQCISFNIKQPFKRHHDIELTRHAFIRAGQRHIGIDKVYATVRGGKVKCIGKHHIKFIKKYKKFELICVGQISCDGIRVFTVETGE